MLLINQNAGIQEGVKYSFTAQYMGINRHHTGSVNSSAVCFTVEVYTLKMKGKCPNYKEGEKKKVRIAGKTVRIVKVAFIFFFLRGGKQASGICSPSSCTLQFSPCWSSLSGCSSSRGSRRHLPLGDTPPQGTACTTGPHPPPTLSTTCSPYAQDRKCTSSGVLH